MRKSCEEQEYNHESKLQDYQQKNLELEADLELMEASLEKMRIYEQSYFSQEKNLR